MVQRETKRYWQQNEFAENFLLQISKPSPTAVERSPSEIGLRVGNLLIFYSFIIKAIFFLLI